LSVGGAKLINMLKFITTEEADEKRKKLSDKIVNMIDRDFNFNLTTVESSQLSENIFELLKEEGTQCQ
jgi:hypothetical protein